MNINMPKKLESITRRTFLKGIAGLALAPFIGGCEGSKGELEKKVDVRSKNIVDVGNVEKRLERLSTMGYPVDENSLVFLGIRKTRPEYWLTDLNVGYASDISNLNLMISNMGDPEEKTKLELLKRHLEYVRDKRAGCFISFYIDALNSSSIDPRSKEKNFTHFIGDFSERDIKRIRHRQNYVFDRKNNFYIGRLE